MKKSVSLFSLFLLCIIPFYAQSNRDTLSGPKAGITFTLAFSHSWGYHSPHGSDNFFNHTALINPGMDTGFELEYPKGYLFSIMTGLRFSTQNYHWWREVTENNLLYDLHQNAKRLYIPLGLTVMLLEKYPVYVTAGINAILWKHEHYRYEIFKNGDKIYEDNNKPRYHALMYYTTSPFISVKMKVTKKIFAEIRYERTNTQNLLLGIRYSLH